MNEKANTNSLLYKSLIKLNTMQFKTFYCIFVHYWANYKYFISNQNFLNLWCELNLLCHELDESFPNPYDDYKKIASFCKSHPYYFIDILPINLITNLFAEFVDDRIDILAQIAKQLYEADLKATYTYSNKALNLTENIEDLVTETQKHIGCFS